MAQLPSSKKILREDLKDAPPWISQVIEPFNSLGESVYQAFNKNITFADNVASFIKELTYKTSVSYPAAEVVEFANTLKTKAIGLWPLQVVDRSTYLPAAGPIYIPWVENNGVIQVGSITGLVASKTYTVRLLVI